MTCLLDTHTLLWIVSDDFRLSETAKRVYLDAANTMLVSMACLWEIAIKVSLKKLTIPGSVSDFIASHVLGNDIGLMEIRHQHLAGLEHLPWHHRDPFDRLLICQAMYEDVPLLSGDPAFDAYPVKRIW
ncbi:type II toxin-antitoxin system VapC family toxin [bacterium]|nr:type II toxin-antitoxin system VapC family toxin [bacterium]